MKKPKAQNVKRKTQNKSRALREPQATYVVPRAFYWWPVTDDKIQQAAQKIVDAAHPEKIILFDILNQLGEQGWERVATPYATDDITLTYKWIFKRPKL